MDKDKGIFRSFMHLATEFGKSCSLKNINHPPKKITSYISSPYRVNHTHKWYCLDVHP